MLSDISQSDVSFSSNEFAVNSVRLLTTVRNNKRYAVAWCPLYLSLDSARFPIVSLGIARLTMRDERIVTAWISFSYLGSINHDRASRAAQAPHVIESTRMQVRARARARHPYMDAALVNGRDGAIRCSICINIYLASLRRALREMEARLPSSPTCLPVPRSRYAGFPREDVPLVLRTGLPFELQTVPLPASSLPSRVRLTRYPRTSKSSYPKPGYQRRHDRSAGIIRRVNGRRYCMQDQPASCTRADAARFRVPSLPRNSSRNTLGNCGNRNLIR